MTKTQSLFKMENPMNLVSRMFILEYIRELGTDIIVPKLTDGEANFWVYKFEGEDDKTEYDFNWEYLTFVIPLPNLGSIMERFLTEVEEIEAKRQAFYTQRREEMLQEEMTKPADINLYDFAKAQIDKSKDTSKLILPND